MVASIREGPDARHGDDRNGCTLLKIENRQRSTVLDLELAVLDGD